MQTQSEVKAQMPSILPLTAAQCRTLRDWRKYVVGKSQAEVAEAARVKPPRISEIELGKVMPRKKYWAALISGYQAPQGKPQLTEMDFYRMIVVARLARSLETVAFQRPVSESHPLLGSARNENPAEIEHLNGRPENLAQA